MALPRGRTGLPAFTLATSLVGLVTLVTLAALTNLLTLTVLTCVASPGGVSAQGEGVGYVKVCAGLLVPSRCLRMTSLSHISG